MSASSLCSTQGLVLTETRFSWPWLWLRHRNGSLLTSCSFPAPSRDLDAPVPSTTSRSGRCSRSSTLVSGTLLVPGSLNSPYLERPRMLLHAPSQAPAQSSRDIAQMAQQPKHWAVIPNLSNISFVKRILLVMIGGSIIWQMHTSLNSGLKEIHTEVDISTNSVSHLSHIS